MMIGLPDSTEKDEYKTAEDLAKLKPKIVRIYPVLVIKGTQLECDYYEGNYEPLDLDKAVERCKELCYFFASKKINVIRIGLQSTDTISDPNNPESDVVAGPYHETFRQLVESEMYYDTIVEKIKGFNTKVKEVEIVVNPLNVNNVVGYKRNNIEKLKNTYNVDVKIMQDKSFPLEDIEVNILREYQDFMEDDDKIKK